MLGKRLGNGLPAALAGLAQAGCSLWFRPPVSRFLFRLSKRRPLPWCSDHLARESWRKDRWGRWNVALVPTARYQLEIAGLTLVFPAIVLVWSLLNLSSPSSSLLPDYNYLRFWLTAASFVPLLLWLMSTWLFQRNEVLTRIWDDIPPEKQSLFSATLDMPVHRLPYSWQRDTGDELLLRYAMKEYFHVPAHLPDKREYFALATLLRWFAAPAYLSLASLYFVATVFSVWGVDEVHFSPSPFGLFIVLSAAWLVCFFWYFTVQSRRILTELDVNPVRASALLPTAVQGAVNEPPNVRSKIVRAVVPGVLTGIAGFSILIFESLLA